MEAIVDAVAGLGFVPVMAHPTSWRIVERELMLTFLVVVKPPNALPPTHEVERVSRAELARGGATSPPPVAHLSQVVEHGLRHLAWLVAEATRSATRCARGLRRSPRTAPSRSAHSVGRPE